MASTSFREYQRPDAPFLQPSSDSFGLVDGRFIERSVVVTSRRLHSQLLHLGTSLSRGDIPLSRYINRSRGAVRVAYFTTYSLGAISVFPFYTLTDADVRILDYALNSEVGFLSAFGRDIFHDQLVLSRKTRTSLYVLALRGIFERGRLEAMPPGPYRWRLGITDHCQDCVRTALNGPYQKSSSSGLGLPVIPGTPGDGRVCLGLTRCGCSYELASGVSVPNEEISQHLPRLLMEVVNGSSTVAQGSNAE